MSNNIPEVDANNIRHGILVEITVNTSTYYLSNLYKTVSYNGNSYTQMGPLLNLGEVQDDLKATNNSLTLSLSGIPSTIVEETDFMQLVLSEPVKGSQVKIYRAFFDRGLNLISTAVYLRFSGYVSNYSLNESWDQQTRSSSNSVILQCSSIHAVLEKKYAGRRTNDKDQKFWYPTDTGMYRVKTLADTSFDFGKPYTAPTGGNTGDTTYNTEQGVG
jgi:hypothetical protein